MSSNIGLYSRSAAADITHRTTSPRMYGGDNEVDDRIGALHWPSGTFNSAAATADQQLSPRLAPKPRPLPGQYESFAGMGLEFGNSLVERVIIYPCVVIRRQCQVNSGSTNRHLTPFTLMAPIYNIYHTQGAITLWKGVFSSGLNHGTTLAVEYAIGELTGWPRELTKQSQWKAIGRHLTLKAVTYSLTTPLLITAVVESVQSGLASESPAALDCVRNAFARVVDDCWFRRDTARRIPIWQLLVPSVTHRIAHYILSGATHYMIRSMIRRHLNSKSPTRAKLMFDEFYPDLFATFASHLAADALLFPLETVLHRLYLQGTRTIIDNLDTGTEVVPVSLRYTGVVNCFASIVSTEGFLALYKGFGALCLQYLLHFAILRAIRAIFGTLDDAFAHRHLPPSAARGQRTPPTLTPPTYAYDD